MCTVTWWSGPDRYDLFFNRDERKSRKPARPPEEAELAGVRYLAPADGDFGGTWILTNEFRLTVCLVNHYPDHFVADPPHPISRGILVRSLASCKSPAEIAGRLARTELERFPPFFLIAVAPDQNGRLWTWNGHSLEWNYHAQAAQPVTSSSFQKHAVTESRRREFHALRQTRTADFPEALDRFHRTFKPDEAAFSICMLRDDAETVSFTRVRVDGDTIEMIYHDKVPGEARFLTPQRCFLRSRDGSLPDGTTGPRTAAH